MEFMGKQWRVVDSTCTLSSLRYYRCSESRENVSGHHSSLAAGLEGLAKSNYPTTRQDAEKTPD